MADFNTSLELHLSTFRRLWFSMVRRYGRHPLFRPLGRNFYLMNYAFSVCGISRREIPTLLHVQSPELRRLSDRHNPLPIAANGPPVSVTVLRLLPQGGHVLKAFASQDSILETMRFIHLIWKARSIIDEEAMNLIVEVLAAPVEKYLVGTSKQTIGFDRNGRHLSLVNFTPSVTHAKLEVSVVAGRFSIEILPCFRDIDLYYANPVWPALGELAFDPIIPGVPFVNEHSRNLRFLIWNVKGMYNIAFAEEAKALVDEYQATAFIFTDTWADDYTVKAQCRGIGLDCVRIYHADVRSSGAVLCFNKKSIKLQELDLADKVVNAWVQDAEEYEEAWPGQLT